MQSSDADGDYTVVHEPFPAEHLRASHYSRRPLDASNTCGEGPRRDISILIEKYEH